MSEHNDEKGVNEMASVNFMKATSQRIGAMKSHLDSEERKTRSHANADIDKSKTPQNYFIGCDGWDDMYKSWKKRTEEADKLHPPTRIKADRVTGVLYEFPCPWEIVRQGKGKEFFEMVHDFMREFFGSENVHGLTVHMDEVHSYLDKDGLKRMSMIHAHGLASPYAHWIDKKGVEHEGINGKHWETREMLRAFNKELNKRCLERFGMELNTHGASRGKTVEELKRESEAISLQKSTDKAVEHLEAFKSQARELKQELAGVTEELKKAQSDLYIKKSEVQSLAERKTALEGKIESIDKALQGKKVSLSKAEAIEKASKTAKMPSIKPKTFGDGVVVESDEKTVKAAFLALEHEKDIAKRERAATQHTQKAKAEAKAITEKAHAEIDVVKEHTAEAELRRIRADHPELFAENGRYKDFTRSLPLPSAHGMDRS